MRDPRDFAAIVKDVPKLKAQVQAALRKLEAERNSP